ncbi:hypothetical protein EV189_2577 [Motilibacter rhizosphaerae]|uniref:Uncharacterized protein n=1 Tax=Motilibacter rhizosphaerae TaxID=598652 RepID=A0A4Q7NPE0_9ACTN|nr:hypothetical protein [Motilibacter rhizosphaerae]RZS87154.1 hypothetical protein EV189_2577 [Motilibacter rhizosphaerae]
MAESSRARRPAARRGSGPLTTQPAADVPTACPHCHGSRVTRMAITLTDGTPVTLMSCSDCDTRSWFDGPRMLQLQDVVDRSTKDGAQGLDLRDRKRTDAVPPAHASRRQS